MKRLAIITTHPIQYNAPLFKLLAARGVISIKVFYTWGEGVLENKHDPGFGKTIEWDIPLLQGYDYCFVNNVAVRPGSGHFNGIKNPTLQTEIKNWGADAVLVYGWAFNSHLAALRYFFKKIPVFFKGDSTLKDEKSGLKKGLRRLLLKWVYGFVDKALYVGRANKAYFLKHGIKENQLVFAPHAVDNNRFEENEFSVEAASALREQLGIKKEELVFLFAGKMEAKKNPLLLVRVFIDLQAEGVQLVMVGNGILEDKVKELAGGNKNIHFLAFQNQTKMPAVYQLADVFVLPSSGPGETWGLAINEAMASGKAVLVSDACGAAADLVVQAKNGFCFESGNKESLKEKMKQLINHKLLLPKMGAASLDIIQDWSFEKNALVIEALLKKENS